MPEVSSEVFVVIALTTRVRKRTEFERLHLSGLRLGYQMLTRHCYYNLGSYALSLSS